MEVGEIFSGHDPGTGPLATRPFEAVNTWTGTASGRPEFHPRVSRPGVANRSTSLLLVDDEEDEFVWARDLLAAIEGRRYDLEWVRGYDSALELAGSNRHDVYLVDYHLGKRDGLELLRDAIVLGCRSPMILLTDAGDAGIESMALESGAADYLVKGQTDSALLERSIRYCLDRQQADEERRLLEHQLQHAQKMEVVGQLAGGIAHDFNNLLTAVLGYAAMGASQAPPGGNLRTSFQEIQMAAERAVDLTRQILAFSRRQATEMKQLSLNDVVLNTEKILRRLIGENIEQKIVTEPDLGTASADPRQLEQVLINIVVNARDAMPSGGKLIIETANLTLDSDYAGGHAEVPRGRYVTLAISDTGTGIPAEVLPHIFEPFFTTKDHGKGTGLGLSISYGVITQAGGHITARTKIGEGTTFTICASTEGARVAVASFSATLHPTWM